MRAAVQDSPRVRGWLAVGLLGLAGGLLFVAILQWRYAGIDPDFYQFRDDGVITLSHARNWVEFGFIGVNPSGDRVEATSAPLQFLLYAVAWLVGGLHYETFMSAQTVVCTFLLGALLAQPFRARPVFAIATTAAIASVLTHLPAFMVWHASGMENAITHVLLLWTVVLLVRFAEQGRVQLGWAAIPFLASITRVDGIYHVAPLLAVFCVYWHWRHRDLQAVRFAAIVALAWVALNAARYAYFGALLPNTAVAQGISMGDRVLELLTLSPTYLDQSFAIVRGNASRHGAYLLLLVLPMVVFRRPKAVPTLLLALCGCVVVTCLFAPFLFGPARLDPARTTTQMALFVPLCVAAAAWQAERTRPVVYGLVLAGVAVLLLAEYNRTVPVRACCSARGFEALREQAQRIAAEQSLGRATVANPDLGAISWSKRFNIVDLGLLASPVIARVPPGPALDGYLLEYVAPDIIETHGYWTCKYATLLADPRFVEHYVRVGLAGAPATIACAGRPEVPTGVWLRKDIRAGERTPERALLDDLARAPSVQRVAEELRRCAAAGSEPLRCAYVARSTYRVLPELRAAGAEAELVTLFAGSPSAPLDLHLVRGALDARAYVPVVRQLDPRRR